MSSHQVDAALERWLEEEYEDTPYETSQAEWEEAQRLAREEGKVN
jgi:hypothetical protein